MDDPNLPYTIFDKVEGKPQMLKMAPVYKEVPFVLADALLWRVPARGVTATSRRPGYTDTIAKDPGAALFCGLNLVDWLGAGTLVSAVASARGVRPIGEAKIEGTCVVLKIMGFDNSDGATNSCTFDFESTTGAGSKTIFFTKPVR